MEDSFFGFDTSAPLDDDGSGGRIAEPSEEEYDALNDETFGSAINGDWEEVHENLVRLTDTHNGDSAENNVGACSNLEKSVGSGGMRLFDALSASSTSSLASGNTRSHKNKNEIDSDLEFNLSGMKLDDVDITFDDGDSIVGNSGINMDPSVWATVPPKISMESKSSGPIKSRSILYSSPFFQQSAHQTSIQQQRPSREMPPFPGNSALSTAPKGPKICTLQDIERSIIIQQTLEKDKKKQRPTQEHDINNRKETPKSPTPATTHQQPPPPSQNQQQVLQLSQQQLQSNRIQPQVQAKGPPGFNQFHGPPRTPNHFHKNIVQHPLGNFLQQHQTNAAGNRMPPGFPSLPLYPPTLPPHLQPQNHPQLPPHPILNQHPIPPNFTHPQPRPLPNPHLPIALNNFAMHPNFNAMRAAAAAAGIHPVALMPQPIQQPRLPPHAGVPPNAGPNSMFNMYNMRLMQEIQQNHPLLQNVSRQQQQPHLPVVANALNMHMLHHQQRNGNGGSGLIKPSNHHQQHFRRMDVSNANGNLPPEEFDDYANLMSTRDKHWLIGIQLSQLNTDTPYIDDFYYTVYSERRALLNGDVRLSKTHKDNQLNHPLTQPRGHAQLILVQLGNKNGTRSNGQHRERRNSESMTINSQESATTTKTPYVFTPLKFENSLGKLQYGSVTAPRKIIDADIMNSDSTANDGTDSTSSNAAATDTNNLLGISKSSTAGGGVVAQGCGIISEISSTQRKSRHILLHIETLFRIVLKLEDLDNPNAIATIIMKKKKENERLLLLEQIENANKSNEEQNRTVEINNSQQSLNPAMKNRFAYEIETKEALVSKLVLGLNHDEVVAMMNVRKGKVLLRRIMPYLCDHDIRWNVWVGVFASLQHVVKKDREDVEGMLYALYPELKKQVQNANFETIVKLASAIPLNDKKTNGVFCSKFGISAVVCLILQAESLHVNNDNATFIALHRNNWRQFLNQVALTLNRTIQSQTICAAIESDSIQPMMDHFARFSDLKLDSLLALITEAKQQIN